MTLYAGGEEVPEWIVSYLSGLLSAAIMTVQERDENNTEGVRLRFVGASPNAIDVTAEWTGVFVHEAPLRIMIGARPQ